MTMKHGNYSCLIISRIIFNGFKVYMFFKFIKKGGIKLDNSFMASAQYKI